MQALKFAIASAIAASLPFVASAQGDDDTTDIYDSSFGMGTLTPPTNLAGSALSIGSDSITRITSSDALVTTLGNGIDANGRFGWTGGLEISPYALGFSVSSEEYRDSRWRRLIANSRISLAFSEGETEESEGSVAVGIQSVLYDRGDTLMRGFEDDSSKSVAAVCAQNEIARAREDSPGIGAAAPPPTENSGTDDSTEEEAETSAGVEDPNGEPLGETQDGSENSGEQERNSDSDLAPNYANCIREIRRSTWNDASLGLGIVTVARANRNEIDDISQSNTVAYLTASYGFEFLDDADEFKLRGGGIYSDCGNGFNLSCNAQILFQLRYQSDGVYEVPTLGERTGEALGWGSKFVAGTARSNGFAFYRQDNVDIEGMEFDVHEYGVGFETRVFGDQWFNLSISRIDNDLLEGDESVVKASISFSFGDAAQFFNPFADG